MLIFAEIFTIFINLNLMNGIIQFFSFGLMVAGAMSASAETTLAAWTSTDPVQPGNTIPEATLSATDTIKAWRGEKINAKAILKSREGSVGEVSLSMPGAYARFMDNVLTDDQRSCGNHNFNLTPWPVADIIGLDWERKLQPETPESVWVSVNVPSDAEPGLHTYTLTVTDSDGSVLATLPLVVDVDEQVLPEPKDWKFHLDFWQQPYAVSRYYGLERWSPEHFEALRPYMETLADAGQKVVSAILFYEPWGVQSLDKFDPMVQTVRKADGSWEFSYDIFDRYVEFMEDCGISKQINCYSMVPWDMSFRYFDEATQEYKTLDTPTGTEAYNDLWSSFLRDFASHLRQKGWFDKTCIAMDERGLEAMMDAHKLVKATVPDMKMSLAGVRHPELVEELYDYCIAYGHEFTPEERAARREKGQVTTVYTCCTEAEPNILSNNNPVDATYLALFAIANDFDGYLHWSWINWTDDPMHDSRFKLFSAGDTYLFYPGPRSSARFEKMVEGVCMAEKIRVLREQGADMTAIDAALAALAPGKVTPENPASAQVAAVRKAIESTK